MQKQFLREKTPTTAAAMHGEGSIEPIEKVEVEVEWQEYVTESGDPYYYNTRTGVVQWEKPDSDVRTSSKRTIGQGEVRVAHSTATYPSTVSVESEPDLDRAPRKRKGMRTYVVDVNLTQQAPAVTAPYIQSSSNININATYNANARTLLHSTHTMRARELASMERSHSDLSSLSDHSSYEGRATLTHEGNTSRISKPNRLSFRSLPESTSSVNLTQEDYYNFRAQYAPDAQNDSPEQYGGRRSVDTTRQPPSLLHPNVANAQYNAITTSDYYHHNVEQPNLSEYREHEPYVNENASANLTVPSPTNTTTSNGQQSEEADKIRHLQVWNRFFENAFSAQQAQARSPPPSPAINTMLDPSMEFKLAAKQLGLRYETLKSSKSNGGSGSSSNSSNAKGLWYHSISEDSYANLTYLSLNGLGLGDHVSAAVVLNVALRASCIRNDVPAALQLLLRGNLLDIGTHVLLACV